MRRESTCLAGKIHPTAAVARCLICPQLSRRASQCTTLLLSPRKLGGHMTSWRRRFLSLSLSVSRTLSLPSLKLSSLTLSFHLSRTHEYTLEIREMPLARNTSIATSKKKKTISSHPSRREQHNKLGSTVYTIIHLHILTPPLTFSKLHKSKLFTAILL